MKDINNKIHIAHIITAFIFVILLESLFFFSSYAFALGMAVMIIPLVLSAIYIANRIISFCVKSKRKNITKGDKITFALVAIIFITLFVRNLLLPIPKTVNEGEDCYIKFKGEKYQSYRYETNWYPTGIGRLTGKVLDEEGKFLAGLFALDRIYEVKGDKEHISYLVRDTLSEFGDYVYYRQDVKFPDFEDIRPSKIEIGQYNTLYTWDILKNKTFARSKDEEIIDEIMQILRQEKTVSYVFSSEEMSILSELDDKKYIELGFFTDQVPGSVYAENIKKEGNRYYIYLNSEEKIDVTYVLLKLMS